jgi:dTDP-4-amino-4,6-dideoxygalactose transaminase
VHQRLLPFDVQKGEFPLWPEMSFKNKAAVKRKFLDLKIGFRDIWLPISTQKPYFSKDPYMNSEQMSNTTLWLPSSFNLTREDINLITQTLICEECK